MNLLQLPDDSIVQIAELCDTQGFMSLRNSCRATRSLLDLAHSPAKDGKRCRTRDDELGVLHNLVCFEALSEIRSERRKDRWFPTHNVWDSATSRSIAMYLIARYGVYLFQPNGDYTASQLLEVALASKKLSTRGSKIATMMLACAPLLSALSSPDKYMLC